MTRERRDPQASQAQWLPGCAAVLVFSLIGTRFVAAEVDSQLPAVDFERDIQPLFAKHCLSCHGPQKQESGYRLDVSAVALQGGDHFAAVINREVPDESPLLKVVSGRDPDLVMPPEGERLSADEVELLRCWLQQGASWPASATTDELTSKHWAYQPIQRPAVPKLKRADTSEVWRSVAPINAVDAFIHAKLIESELAPALLADRRTLIRRLHFTVTGLAPTPEEVRLFEADADPLAYERLVDRLLASPHLGEKWARHWLDVVRFAESNGFETNHERPNAWRYRDYVIQAFNQDKPFSDFVFEQIAGDSVGQDAATGFLVGGAYDIVKGQDIGLQLMQRSDELADMVNTTSTVFLASTLGCARCHSHKFDPIPQTDFYSLQAVFAGVQHGDREMQLPEFAEHERRVQELTVRLKLVEERLTEFEPRAALGRTILIDEAFAAGPQLPAATPGATVETPLVDSPTSDQVIAPQSVPPIRYDAGRARGQLSDPGTGQRWPNITETYLWWTQPVGTNLFTWNPHAKGTFQVWTSWGAWTTHAANAIYVLDHDGDLTTTADQQEIGRVDQRTFADGAPAVPNERRWSGFYSLGQHALTATSCVLLRAGDERVPTVADVMLFEEVSEGVTTTDPGANPPRSLPHARMPVSHLATSDRITVTPAKYVRFTITACSSGEPCLDELQIFSQGSNVALASQGAKVTASGTYANNSKHTLEHLNDGRFGNDFSWISNTPGSGWVTVEFPERREIDHIAWSRDRGGEEQVYQDRLATGYRIEVSLDGQAWATVAGSYDRLPDRLRDKVTSLPGKVDGLGLIVDGQQPAANPALVGSLSVDQPSTINHQLTYTQLRADQERLSTEIAALRERPKAYAGTFTQPEPTKRLHRGDSLSPQEVVAPDGLTLLRSSLGSLGLPPDAPEQDRRLAYARWLTDARHPLPARVMVNRLWQNTFGMGLVATPSDFGAMGFRPTHPELLDWLAAELISNNWSLKHIQRLLLTSATFQQSSHPVEAALRSDAGNTLLWRFSPRRLEAELIRDAILRASGALSDSMQGPGFLLHVPNNNYSRNWVAQTEFDPDDYRRMVYEQKLRMKQDAVFSAFDIPDAGQVCPSRPRSTTPIQALNLFNSGFLLQESARLAQRVTDLGGSAVDVQIGLVFSLTINRSPTPAELAGSRGLVQEHGLPALCRAMLNSNEFLFVE